MQRVVEVVELAPLVTKISRDPQHRADRQEEEATKAGRHDIGDLLSGIDLVAHANPTEEEDERAEPNPHPRTDTVPLLSDVLQDLHATRTPRNRKMLAPPSVINPLRMRAR
jgi:hypothetical protein